MTPAMLELMAMNVLSATPGADPERVREVVTGLATVTLGATYPALAEVIEAVARAIETKLDITMADSASIQIPFEPWLERRRATIDPFYWNRYRRLLSNKLGPRVLGTLDKDTDKIVGLLEDPQKTGAWKRRGLCVGHVQSGKTANYIGVIAKAADYGYKFIVLLAGIHNSLRRQTQERVEEGFVGIDTAVSATGRSATRDEVRIGVGLIDSAKRPVYATTAADDFRTTIANSAGISFQSVSEPIVLVIKKQKTVLENLFNWLHSNNTVRGRTIRNVPLLLIDDEADNASINTRGEDDPTQINRLIRKLLAQFEQNCYLGYTATPFANIFINPDSDDAMLQEDLFPRDFIVSLEPPDNYIGPERIFGEGAELSHIVSEVSDHLEIFHPAHKIGHVVEVLPESLLDAIRCFVLIRAMRMLRGQRDEHNSMLVNVSRFNPVQQQISSLITHYLAQLRDAVQGHAALPGDDAIADPCMAQLRATWRKHFVSAGHDWPEIQRILNDAVGPITVRTINIRSADTLDYKAHREHGLNVIAVGGLSLSRGLTLEGLTVSYFVRNTMMYDTLLQMGRWFGYRNGYGDLCRLFMTSDAVSWYRHITEAIIELRAEFRTMERQNRRPEDFGLKVRAHPDTLIVTARNKMRSGRRIKHSISLRGRLIETVALRRDAIAHNYQCLDEFVRLLDSQIHASASGFGAEDVLWRRVPTEMVEQFLRCFRNHDDASVQTQLDPLIRFIGEHRQYLAVWDVCLYSPASGVAATELGLRQVRPARRASPLHGDHYRVSGASMRVASRGAERAGLSDAQIDAAHAEFAGASPENATRNISDRYFRSVRQLPLLMLHVLRLDSGELGAAWGISFPGSLPETDTVEYIVNTTWYRENFGDEAEEDADDEE